jgi:hypothetical protein
MKRGLLLLWLVACAAVLVFAVSQREFSDMDIAFTYFMFFLSAPAGFAVGYLFGFASIFISLPSGLVYALVTWPLFVVLGYLQWFVFTPWLYRTAKRWLNEKRT